MHWFRQWLRDMTRCVTLNFDDLRPASVPLMPPTMAEVFPALLGGGATFVHDLKPPAKEVAQFVPTVDCRTRVPRKRKTTAKKRGRT